MKALGIWVIVFQLLIIMMGMGLVGTPEVKLPIKLEWVGYGNL